MCVRANTQVALPLRAALENNLFHLRGLCLAHGQEAPGALLAPGMGNYPQVSEGKTEM